MERNGKGIFRESYTVGQGQAKPKGYTITEDCISCGACVEAYPQRAITLGAPSVIHQEHCLYCGNCVEHCPVAAVIPREQETVSPET